jgi:hypothetical protein
LVAFCSNWTVDFWHDNSTAFAGITLIKSAAASGVFILFMLFAIHCMSANGCLLRFEYQQLSLSSAGQRKLAPSESYRPQPERRKPPG